MTSAWPEGQAGSGFHLDNVPLSQLPPGGDPHVITVQLHHGCVGRRGMGVGDQWCVPEPGRTVYFPPTLGPSRAETVRSDPHVRDEETEARRQEEPTPVYQLPNPPQAPRDGGGRSDSGLLSLGHGCGVHTLTYTPLCKQTHCHTLPAHQNSHTRLGVSTHSLGQGHSQGPEVFWEASGGMRTHHRTPPGPHQR